MLIESYIHTHTHAYIYIHTHTHIYIHTHTHIYIHIHTHTHTCIHIHSHSHPHSHTYMCGVVPERVELVRVDLREFDNGFHYATWVVCVYVVYYRVCAV
jgi:hypothetical protein